MKQSIFFIFCLLSVLGCLLFVHTVHAFTFSRNLSVGSLGQDVLELQKILNTDSYTEVATTGMGSPGNETSYFGTKTLQAVLRFQHKYAPEVLFPAGVYTGTGFVGLFTLKKLNFLSASSSQTSFTSSSRSPALFGVPVSAISPLAIQNLKPTTTFPIVSQGSDFFSIFSTKSKPIFFNLSRYEAKRGMQVMIHGSGFLNTGNTVYLGPSYHIDNLPATENGSTLSFVVPSEITNSSYNVWVVTSNGTTFNSSSGNFFTVTDNPNDPPVITGVTPQKILYATSSTITITGSGFTTNGNDIYSGLGTAMNTSSFDGITIQVQLSSFSQFVATGAYQAVFKQEGVSVPIFVVVHNKGGISNIPVTFLLQY